MAIVLLMATIMVTVPITDLVLVIIIGPIAIAITITARITATPTVTDIETGISTGEEAITGTEITTAAAGGAIGIIAEAILAAEDLMEPAVVPEGAGAVFVAAEALIVRAV